MIQFASMVVALALLSCTWMVMMMPMTTMGFLMMIPPPTSFSRRSRSIASQQVISLSSSKGGTDMKPLYDGTNYTFPDTTTPTGIAELLEVSFVHACMQLRTGHVDVLKLFIAAAVGGYEFGHSLTSLEEALQKCKTNTAGRDLLPEELQLRKDWVTMVYFMLSKIGHPTTSAALAVDDSFEDAFVNNYQSLVEDVARRHLQQQAIPSIETLLQDDTTTTTDDPMQKALKAQTLRVATMTLVVLQDAKESQPGGAAPPPNPPIPGAFE
jgi:hypothetical protein